MQVVVAVQAWCRRARLPRPLQPRPHRRAEVRPFSLFPLETSETDAPLFLSQVPVRHPRRLLDPLRRLLHGKSCSPSSRARALARADLLPLVEQIAIQTPERGFSIEDSILYIQLLGYLLEDVVKVRPRP